MVYIQKVGFVTYFIFYNMYILLYSFSIVFCFIMFLICFIYNTIYNVLIFKMFYLNGLIILHGFVLNKGFL